MLCYFVHSHPFVTYNSFSQKKESANINLDKGVKGFFSKYLILQGPCENNNNNNISYRVSNNKKFEKLMDVLGINFYI